MRSKHTLAAVVFCVAAVAAPGVARAFADVSQFFDNAANPHAATLGASAEGVYFTGAPRFASLTCQSCHEGGPERVGLRINADDVALFSDGYIPGRTYALEVQLTDEQAGGKFSSPTCTDAPSADDTFSFVPCNSNGYALEVDAAGVALGGLCARAPAAGACPPADLADESFVAPGGDAVFSNRVRSPNPDTPKLLLRNGATRWHLWWTAPRAGTGPVTVYVAAVDGNGGDGTAAVDQDPYGDDTVQGNFYLQEAGDAVRNRASAGCAVVPAPVSTGLGALGLIALAALVLRRAAQRRRCQEWGD
ncbi:MAG: hypothetical protein JWN44_6776 [Myxococcales bacterium]|nr:hypothetical protein [Myxococcales bacterium]